MTCKPDYKLYADEYSTQDGLLTGSVESIEFEPNVKHKAVVSHWFSPVEFHVVFWEHVKKLKSYFSKMHKFYERHDEKIDSVEFAINKACVVKDQDGIWRRGELNLRCHTEYHVKIVDLGYEVFVPIANIKCLVSKFSKYPPLAVKCILSGCHRDICYRDILDPIEKHCSKRIIRTVLFANRSFPLNVCMFDMDDTDLFDKFFGPLLRKMDMAEKQRAMAIKNGLVRKKKYRCESPSTEEEEYIYDSDEDQMNFSSGVPVMINRTKR